MTSAAVSTSSTTQAHSYATRIRHSVSSKPSIRLKPAIDPQRAIRPAPTPTTDHHDSTAPIHQTPFPSVNVVLHPEDANSKVFHAIARALLSVDNRAMTVKDLADMCLKQGLQCQNANAASQAITTYTRDHLRRCDQEQDQPLLLRHILSGTPSDDLLLPALHSTSGGGPMREQQLQSANRTTNFRKGTVIWYLSRVTGAPCPFARAGIRLCDHVDADAPAPLKTNVKRAFKETRIDRCGDKRKRRSTRECVIRHTQQASHSLTHSDIEQSDREGEPPTKVKLMVRLKPLAKCIATPASGSPSDIIDLSMNSDEDSDSMSVDDEDDDQTSYFSRDSMSPVDSLPQVSPRRSLSVLPHALPSCSSSPSPQSHAPDSDRLARLCRSTSVSDSMASPPPDSEEDEEDAESLGDNGSRDASLPLSPSPFVDDEAGEDEEGDGYASSEFSSEFEDNDADTSFESPGPRSPFPTAHISLPSVKQEPRDVQDILDAWEGLDSIHFAPTTAEEARVVEVIGKAATCVLQEAGHIADEDTMRYDLAVGDWDAQRLRLSSSPLAVKQEDDDLTLDFHSSPFTAWRDNEQPMSPLSASSPDSNAFRFDDFSPLEDYSSPAPRLGSDAAWLSPDSPSFGTLRPQANPVSSLGGIFGAEEYSSDRAGLTKSLTSLIESLSVTKPSIPQSPPATEFAFQFGPLPQPPCVSPNDIRLKSNGASSAYSDHDQAVVVNTCLPSDPPIVATQVEGISVYRIILGDQVVLRRIDTDFVNLTPILNYSKTPQPVLSTIPSATTIVDCSTTVNGTWIPLDVAQTYVKDHPVPTTSTATSSAGTLDLFLSDKLSDYFPQALRDFVQCSERTSVVGQFGKRFGPPQAKDLASQAASMVAGPISTVREEMSRPMPSPYDAPLTETEQEIFQSICVNLEWEREDPLKPHDGPEEHDSTKSTQSEDTRPLRRSKRVADARAKIRPRR